MAEQRQAPPAEAAQRTDKVRRILMFFFVIMAVMIVMIGYVMDAVMVTGVLAVVMLVLFGVSWRATGARTEAS